MRLRPLDTADDATFHEHWNDREVGRFLWDGKPVPMETVREVIESSRSGFQTRGFGLWAAELRDSGVTVGFCGLRPDESGEIELLYAFQRSVWGRGLCTEAAAAVVGHAFRAGGLQSIVAGTNPANPASWRVLERIGMIREGTRKPPHEELWMYRITRDRIIPAGGLREP